MQTRVDTVVVVVAIEGVILLYNEFAACKLFLAFSGVFVFYPSMSSNKTVWASGRKNSCCAIMVKPIFVSSLLSVFVVVSILLL